jgi:hypothetical protein
VITESDLFEVFVRMLSSGKATPTKRPAPKKARSRNAPKRAKAKKTARKG